MDTIYFVDSDGKKRKGISGKCASCDKEFITRIDQPKNYCSRECARSKQKNNIDCVCSQCGIKFQRPVSKTKCSKSGLYFCSRQCKDKAQRIGGIKEIMPPHYGTGEGEWSYREFFKKEEFVCARCEYDEFSCGVSIHHIDHNRRNNDKSNLVPLCMPCHIALHFNFWKFEEINWTPFNS